MKKETSLLLLFLFLALLPSLHAENERYHATQTAISSLPYTMNFDNISSLSDAGWSVKTTSTGMPLVNIPAYRIYSNNVAYIHSLPNSFETYMSGTTTYTFLISPRLEVDITTLKLSLYYYAGVAGGSIQIGVLPDTSDISTFEVVKSISTIQSTWTNLSAYFHEYAGSGEFIAIKFSNARTSFYVDDIIMKESPNCQDISQLRVLRTIGTAAQLTWEPSATIGAQYVIEYAHVDSASWNSVTSDTSYVTISGLNNISSYKVRVRTDCGAGVYSDYSEVVMLNTVCDEYSGIEIAPAKSNTNGAYLPVHFGNKSSVSQQIFLAEELQNLSRNIDLLELQYFYNTAVTRNISIYMGHTSASSFSDYSDWISPTNMNLVFSGNISFNNNNPDYWLQIPLHTAFQYNGNDNIVLLFVDSTRTSANSNTKFYTHTTTNNRSIYYYHNTDTIDIYNPAPTLNKGLVNTRTNIRFLECAQPECSKPQFVKINNITDHSLDISWLETSTVGEYKIEYRSIYDTAWSSVISTDYPMYTLSGLHSGVLYDVRMMKDCSPEYSQVTDSIRIRTLCGGMSVSYFENFDSYSQETLPACWSSLSSETTGVVKLSTSAPHSAPGVLSLGKTDTLQTLAILPPMGAAHWQEEVLLSFWVKATTVDNGSFTIGSMSDNTSFSSFNMLNEFELENANTWKKFEYPVILTSTSPYLAFSWENGTSELWIDDISVTPMPSCLYPAVSASVDTTQANITWVETGYAQSWDIRYYPVDRPSEESIVPVNMLNNYTFMIEDLQPNTAYGVAMRSHCTSDTSDWSQAILFTTKAIPTNLPYHCDFENPADAGNWVLVNGDEVNKWYIDSVRVNGSDTTGKVLYISNDGGTSHGYSITNASNVWAYRDIYFGDTDGEYLLSFDWIGRGDNGNDYMQVYIGDTNSVIYAGSSTTPSGAVAIGNKFYAQRTWDSIAFYLPASYEGEMKRLFFLWHNNNTAGLNPPAAVNNIKIHATSCFAISNVTVSDITTGGATVTWDRGAGENQWFVEYGTYGFTPGTGTPIVVSDTFYHINMLSEGVIYEVYVSSYCGVDTTGAPISTYFSTECEALTLADLPASENFENWGSGKYVNYPACWKRVSNFGNSPYITPYNGTNALRFSSSVDQYTIAILNELGDDINLSDLQVTFKMSCNTASYALTVGVMEGGFEISNFVELDSVFVTDTTWHRFSIPLERYSGNSKHIALRTGNLYASLYIDDVSIRPYVPCNAPQNFVIDTIEAKSATLSWTSSSNDSVWIVSCTPENGTTRTYNVYSPQIQLTNLTPNTAHQVRIYTLCEGEDISATLDTSFTTPFAYHTISAVAGENGSISPSGDIIVIEGSDTTFVIRANALYEISGVWVDEDLKGSDSTYRFRNVRTNHTIRAEFRLEGSGYPSYENESVLVYPNPVKETLNVKSEQLFDSYSITNLLGQTLISGKPEDFHFQLNLSSLQKGVYFIRLVSKEGKATTVKFIKE